MTVTSQRILLQVYDLVEVTDMCAPSLFETSATWRRSAVSRLSEVLVRNFSGMNGVLADDSSIHYSTTLVYSYRNDSTGSTDAAFLAGKNPSGGFGRLKASLCLQFKRFCVIIE